MDILSEPHMPCKVITNINTWSYFYKREGALPTAMRHNQLGSESWFQELLCLCDPLRMLQVGAGRRKCKEAPEIHILSTKMHIVQCSNDFLLILSHCIIYFFNDIWYVNIRAGHAVSCGYAHMWLRFSAYIFKLWIYFQYAHNPHIDICGLCIWSVYVSAYTNKSKHLYFKTDYGVSDHHLKWMNTHNLYN